MKINKTIFTILILLACIPVFGQQDSTGCIVESDSLNQNIYLFVDKMPKPKKGQEYLFKQLSKEVKLGEISKNEPIGSMTIISFVINEKGEIKNKEIEREDFKKMKIPEQMFKVIESIEWEVGSCQGIPVSVKYRLPFRICLR